MRLSDDARVFSLGGIPMVGNVRTSGVIGLTDAGHALCREMANRDVSASEVDESCRELVRHLELGGYLRDGTTPAPRVQSAYLHVTQRCNLSCRLCYSEGEDRNALPDPTLEELGRAVSLLRSLGVARLVISGGEPFLRSDLPQIAACAREQGIEQVIVLTNGLLVTKRAAGELSGLVDCVAVAFDGASAGATAHLRGSQNFERLVDAVLAVREAGIEARVLPTLHAKNLEDMAGYRKLAASLGASLGFSLLTAGADDLGELALNEEQLRELGSGPGALVGTDDEVLSEGPRLCARLSCGAGSRTLSVAADGTVYPCHMLHVGDLAMGNAFTDAAKKIMGGPVAATCASLSVERIEGCRDCDLRYACGGGCRARALLSTGDIWACDPYCELSRSHYESMGRQLAQRFGPKGGDSDDL